MGVRARLLCFLLQFRSRVFVFTGLSPKGGVAGMTGGGRGICGSEDGDEHRIVGSILWMQR